MPNETETKRISISNLGILFSLIAVIVLACVFGYGYVELSQATMALAQTVTNLEVQTKNSQNNVATLHQSIDELKQATEKAQQKTQESAAEEQATSDLYSRLALLDNQLDQLPLPLSPQPAKAATSNHEVPVEKSGLSWWQTGLNHFWQTLSQLVVVRYIGTNSLPLTSPEEKSFLYQNLHAQIAAAMWGVLHHNASVYQASLMRTAQWVQRYFVQDAPETKTMLQQLQDLQKATVSQAAQ